MVTHFREYWLFGLFFAVVTPLQVAWSCLLLRAPGHRRLLLAGALLNGGIALVWLVSRTVGLPVGPERLEAEGVGVKDVLATYGELLIAGLVCTLLMGGGRRQAPGWALGIAWILAAAGVMAALVAGGGH